MWPIRQYLSAAKPGERLWLAIAASLGGLGMIVVVASLVVLVGWTSELVESHDAASEDVLIGQASEGDGVADDASNNIVVDVSGAVVHPGLYQVQPGARVGEIIEQAGGLALSAATTRIAQEINLATVVTDGQKIFIPFTGDQEEVGEVSRVALGTENKDASMNNAKTNELISINSASKEELDSLPGIGEKRAEAIIAGRPYTDINTLVTEGAITAALLADIESLISL